MKNKNEKEREKGRKEKSVYGRLTRLEGGEGGSQHSVRHTAEALGLVVTSVRG